MGYQSPIEAPPGRFARFAVRAGTPYWTALVAGTLPAFIWAIANAWLLGCRDARKQTIVALVGYGIVTAIGCAQWWINFDGLFIGTFGRADGQLVYNIVSVTMIIGSLGVLRYLSGRQLAVASYRSTLGSGLPWGLWLIALLIAAERYLWPHIYDWATPHISWIWLRAVMW
jgi:hypothetical protein